MAMYRVNEIRVDVLIYPKVMKLIFLSLIILKAMSLQGCQRAKFQSLDDKTLCLYLNVQSPSSVLMEQVVTELRRRGLNCQKVIKEINDEYEFLKRTQKLHIGTDNSGALMEGKTTPFSKASLLSKELEKKCLEMGGVIMAGKCKFD